MLASATPTYMPYVAAAGIAFAIYRRIRSHFGWQPWRPKRTIARVALMLVALAALSIVAAMDPARNWPVGVAALAGAVLAIVALRLMRFDARGGQAGYTPDPWIGAALTALLLGRLVWRFATGGFQPAPASSPITLAIGAMVVSFYVVQGAGLLLRMKRMSASPG